PCLRSEAATDWDADFTYDYETLRVGGLIFAGVVVFLSFVLLLGNRVRNCGKTKVSLLMCKSHVDL
uniref:FXYD domain-containing ion transport regulator n=1 Tax=Poecilia latipinna TaxID=48699 RepID=A0A3B3UZ86_9TELE